MTELGDRLRQRLAALAESGAAGFDPARWRYLASLVRRSRGKRDAVKAALDKKIRKSLDDFQERFDRQRASAADTLARAASKDPLGAKRMQRLFDKGRFKDVHQLAERRPHRHRQGELIALTKRIAGAAPAMEKQVPPPPFETLLQQQEARILQSLDPQALDDEASPHRRDEPGADPLHALRKTWAALNAQRRVASTLRECPENAGPLNSQMLATRCLFIMRRLSPAYLTRFISHIDTLLWLEQAGRAITPRTDKKRGRSR